jgi:hypothetical protein
MATVIYSVDTTDMQAGKETACEWAFNNLGNIDIDLELIVSDIIYKYFKVNGMYEVKTMYYEIAYRYGYEQILSEVTVEEIEARFLAFKTRFF